MSELIELAMLNGAGMMQRPERSDAAANRTLILRTAERLFAERGVANVHMADIAEAAGVGKGTLYRRFTNKSELCLNLLDSQMQEFQNTMLAVMRAQTAGGMRYLEQLDRFLDSLVHFTEVHSPLLSEVQRGLMLQDERNLNMPHYWLHMTISALLRAAVRAGELPEHLDTDYLADAILYPLQADLFRFQRRVRGFSLERISAGIRSVVAGLHYA
jgi:AcrR family transcriptional regulator